LILFYFIFILIIEMPKASDKILDILLRLEKKIDNLEKKINNIGKNNTNTIPNKKNRRDLKMS